MPLGKPAGVRCAQLTVDNRCRLFGLPERPAVCVNLRPEPAMCGSDDASAYAFLIQLEDATLPLPPNPYLAAAHAARASLSPGVRAASTADTTQVRLSGAQS